MKILLIAEQNLDNSVGGVTTHCKKLKWSLEKMGDKVDFLYPDLFENISIFEKKIVNYQVLEQKIKSTEYDIYHIHGMASFFVGNCMKIAANLGKKIVYTPHYHPFIYLKRPPLAWLFFKLKIQPILKKQDIICLSQQEVKFFLKKVREVHLIPGGHSISNQLPHVKGNYILFVGRLDNNKNFEFVKNNVDFIDIKVVIPKSVRIPVVNDCHRVKYICNVSDVELGQLYRQALCTVVPSKYEALSLVSLESLAHGTPIIVSDRVQIKDYFPADICHVYPYNNSRLFIEKIQRLKSISDEKYYEISSHCIKEAQTLTWDEMSKKVRSVYKSITK